jgi:hypothetical protein
MILMFIAYSVFHFVCSGITYGIIYKATENIYEIDRSEKRFFGGLASMILGPFSLVFALSMIGTLKTIENMDPEIKKMKSELEELKNKNADLELKHADLDLFVKELKNV